MRKEKKKEEEEDEGDRVRAAEDSRQAGRLPRSVTRLLFTGFSAASQLIH